MSEHDRDAGTPGHGASAAGDADPSGSPSRRPPWVTSAAALAAGVVLGAGGTWLATSGGDGATTADGAPTPSATGTPDPQATVIEQVTVPQSCMAIADEAEGLNGVLVEGFAAARDLDASVMSGVVRDFGSRQEKIQRLSEQCREGVRNSETPSPGTSPTPSTSMGDEATESATSE